MSESADLPATPDPADLRFAGEEVSERIDLGGSRIAVTSHRVLVLTPEGPGRRFRSVYRPNVTGVEHGARADRTTGRRALQASVYGVVLAAAGLLLDLDGLVAGVDLSGTGALGGAAAAVRRLLAVLALLDDALLFAGLLAGAVAVTLAGLYLWRRDRGVRIEVAGGDPVSLPAREQEAAAQRLRAALRGDR